MVAHEAMGQCYFKNVKKILNDVLQNKELVINMERAIRKNSERLEKDIQL